MTSVSRGATSPRSPSACRQRSASSPFHPRSRLVPSRVPVVYLTCPWPAMRTTPPLRRDRDDAAERAPRDEGRVRLRGLPRATSQDAVAPSRAVAPPEVSCGWKDTGGARARVSPTMGRVSLEGPTGREVPRRRPGAGGSAGAREPRSGAGSDAQRGVMAWPQPGNRSQTRSIPICSRVCVRGPRHVRAAAARRVLPPPPAIVVGKRDHRTSSTDSV